MSTERTALPIIPDDAIFSVLPRRPRRIGPLFIVSWLGVFAGLGLVTAATAGAPLFGSWLWVVLPYGLIAVGGIGVTATRYAGSARGIKHDGIFFASATSRGYVGWALGVVITGFYVLLYWLPEALEGGIRMLDPLATALSGSQADRWFMYGFMYTLAILVMGVRMFMKYRHNRYQVARTASVMFFQLGFAFLLPQVLEALNQPEFYFTYFWPLKPEYFYPPSQSGWLWNDATGVIFIGVAAFIAFAGVPVLTYLFGKRWYCSWVCGCGGLAETAGDPFRQLSDKSTRAWRAERWTIHLVLVAVVLVTAMLWLNEAAAGGVLGSASQTAKRCYGFVIGALFSGVVGVGFYPILGSRVWCRFGCPQAAILGIIQRYFSRFRITTNGGQCMACGNCSTYCEMGIDVRAYAHRGANVVRASCVGCGVCAAVCPRGVLRLENGRTHSDRFPGADRPLAELSRSLCPAERESRWR